MTSPQERLVVGEGTAPANPGRSPRAAVAYSVDRPGADRSWSSWSGRALGRRLRPILGRAALFFGIWLILSAPDLGALPLDPLAATADLVMAVMAATIVTWVSLWALPPGARAWRLSVLLPLIGRFLTQSVLGGIDVARRAFHPRLPLRPGCIVFPTRLRAAQRRALFETLTSAMPGAIVAGTDAQGRLIYHCLDTRLPVAQGLARDEQLLLRLFREDLPR
ncbi:Na+/H+ antiporter subunit E [Thiohalocapsa marina]|nr:Na+/H+ antiporter subunit E [Thiohalocapsa marina]